MGVIAGGSVMQVLPYSYLRLVDSCITQIKAQGPSRTCNESKEEVVHLPTHRQLHSWDQLQGYLAHKKLLPPRTIQ